MNDFCNENPDDRLIENGQVPTEGTLIGLDYGSKRIGIAISTRNQSIASPLENFTRYSLELDAKIIAGVATDYQAVGLVVGLPVHMSGDEGGQAREARQFGEWAANATGLPVCYWDERYTSSIAEMYLLQSELSEKKRKGRRDKVAAQVMLQSFLDSDDRQAKPRDLRSL